MLVDEDINPPGKKSVLRLFSSDERHLVVPLATELFRYYYLYSNEIETNIVVDEDFNPPGKKASSVFTVRTNDILSFPLQPSYFFITIYTVTR